MGGAPLAPATRLQLIVQDEAGKRIKGAKAVLRAAHPKSTKKRVRGMGQTYQARTTRRREYVFEAVPRGKCVLFVRGRGYRNYQAQIVVKAKRSQTLTVKLKASSG